MDMIEDSLISHVEKIFRFCLWTFVFVGHAVHCASQFARPMKSEAEGFAHSVKGTAPWWLSCRNMPAWRNWRHLATKQGLLNWRGHPKPLTLSLANSLLVRHRRLAFRWISYTGKANLTNLDVSCSAPVPLHRMMDANNPALFSVFRQRSYPLLQPWLGFCPAGYMAALFVSARGMRQAGWRRRALQLLTLLQQMFGACSEFDLLEPMIWGFDSSDVDADLMAIQLGDTYWRDRLQSVPDILWHALQLNTLVRLRLRDVLLSTTQLQRAPPKLALLAAPTYLSFFLVPFLEKCYGEALSLSLFRIGNGNFDERDEEKCPDCLTRYQSNYFVSDTILQSIPFNSSFQFKTGSGCIIWSNDFSINDFNQRLEYTMRRNPRLLDAEVLLCTAPMWICAATMRASNLPILVLDLILPTVFMPDEDDRFEREDLGTNPTLDSLLEDQQANVASQFWAWLSSPSTTENLIPRSLWIRTDPTWSYGRGLETPYSRVPAAARGFFYPFVNNPSIYINARYRCSDSADVVVMREGSWPRRFAMSLRGRVFMKVLTMLTQGAHESAPWRLRMLPFNMERFSYEDIARHRAAIWVPLAPCCKATFSDLVTMEIPLFMPERRLQATISGGWQCNQYLPYSGPMVWRRRLCILQEVEQWLPLSRFSRYPHVQRFESVAELASLLFSMSCTNLSRISSDMARWNEWLLLDDLEFWRSAIAAFQTESELTKAFLNVEHAQTLADVKATHIYQLKELRHVALSDPDVLLDKLDAMLFAAENVHAGALNIDTGVHPATGDNIDATNRSSSLLDSKSQRAGINEDTPQLPAECFQRSHRPKPYPPHLPGPSMLGYSIPDLEYCRISIRSQDWRDRCAQHAFLFYPKHAVDAAEERASLFGLDANNSSATMCHCLYGPTRFCSEHVLLYGTHFLTDVPPLTLNHE